MQTPTHWQPFRAVQSAGVAFTCIIVFWPQMTKVGGLLLKRGSIPDPRFPVQNVFVTSVKKVSGVFFPPSLSLEFIWFMLSSYLQFNNCLVLVG